MRWRFLLRGLASPHRVSRLKAPYVSPQVAGSALPTALDAGQIIAKSAFWSMAPKCLVVGQYRSSVSLMERATIHLASWLRSRGRLPLPVVHGLGLVPFCGGDSGQLEVVGVLQHNVCAKRFVQ